MVLLSDLARISRGAAMVLDRVGTRLGPEARDRLSRVKFHAVQTVQALWDLNQPLHPTGNSTTTNASADSTNSAQAKPTKPVDLIGFDSLDEKDTKITDTQSVFSRTVLGENPHQNMMRERSVPSTQIGRVVGFGSLAMKLALGEVLDRTTAVITGTDSHTGGSKGLSDRNAERLAESLCRMRGAALKLGQMLSLQDSSRLPPALSKALERVKHAADYMPQKQLEKQLVSELGPNWKDSFESFEFVPIAAASIGQVHRAVLKDGTVVAMKIQYPGVAESIHSDLANLKTIIGVANFLPPGLFIDNIIKVAGSELVEECNYEYEAASQIRYRKHVLSDPLLSAHTSVPEVFTELSTRRVLTSRLVPGVSVDQAINLPQAVRNAIARTVLTLTIRELFQWRFIQSDPNFANFLYDHPSRTVNLIDFGASRAYPKKFVDGYMHLVWAAASRDREAMMRVSGELGFFTGDESAEFLEAHGEAGMVIGEPFLTNEPFDFSNTEITARISNYAGTFMKHRLTPPPTEVYSLHRKLAGAFMLCIRLKANIPCRDILEDAYYNYKWGPEESVSV